ncbi:MAG: cellulase family glycosylhydrolase [Protaetiibacter sp.]
MVGPKAAEEFWTRFRDSFFAEEDVAAIAEAGFDHIRLPINSRVVMTESGDMLDGGLELIDRAIAWCRDRGLSVLLDLHGAPGGQTGTNIDDSPHGRPELFIQARYRAQAVELWTELARRYRDEPAVMGYDLLNEPLPNEWQHVYRDELAALYRDLTSAIRAVDPNHLLMYEGAHWATNWDLFTEVWDDNSCLQFHKYWSAPDTASLRRFLDARERLGLPIYMGEGGENNPEWLYTAFRLYEHHGIGWNLWPWKKVGTVTSPLSIRTPKDWDAVVEMAAGGAAIDGSRARRILDELIESMPPSRCDRRPEVTAAVFGDAPSVIPAWGFGFEGPGRSFQTSAAKPLATIRADDAVTVRFQMPRAAEGNPFEHPFGAEPAEDERLIVNLEAGDWLHYPLPAGTADYRALAPGGEPARELRIDREADGVRVSATGSTAIWRLVRTDAAYPGSTGDSGAA